MFKPLLAPNEDPLSFPDYFEKLKYPLLASPKYDGIRCVVKEGRCLSRTGKLLPSFQVQEMFKGLEHFDGEIIEGNPTDFDVYNRTQSHVMSEDKPGEMTFFAFDLTHPDYLDRPFHQRQEYLEKLIEIYTAPVKLVEQVFVDNYQELIAFEEKCLTEGFEGIMLRDPNARYKQGRGTFREGIIYKLKRFHQDEGVIIGFKEQMTNTNTQERSELGYAKRSQAKEGLVGAQSVGAFVVAFNDQELDIAPGAFNHAEREIIWNNQEYYLGEVLTFRHFPHGMKDKPRFPRAVGFRTTSNTAGEYD